jgi:hypothetical protein
MIRHTYDPSQTVYPSSPITHLMFHVNVFAAADKYDVPSLRVLVVNKFTQLMKQRYSTSQQEFCTTIQHLCGPAAASFADTSLQKATASYCSDNIRSLIKLDAFVSMLEECGPFTVQLLTTTLRHKSVIETYRCPNCILNESHSPQRDLRFVQSRERRRCFTCNATQDVGRLGTVSLDGSKRFEHYKSLMEL